MIHFLKKFAGFCSVGALMTVLSMVLIAITNEVFSWHPEVSYIFSYVVTLLLSYLLNLKFVFHSRYSWKGLFSYCMTYLCSMLFGMALLWLLMRVFPTTNRTLLSYCMLPVTTLWNYFFTKKISALP